jgi:formate dehydrogenase
MTTTARPTVDDTSAATASSAVRRRSREAGTSAVDVVTYCRICEPLCGMVATVDDGEVVAIRGDREHPVSEGYLCPKGFAMLDVQRDPDRVLYPLKRVGGPGEFERCTWDEALDDIAGRLRELIRRHGKDSIGAYLGNPAGMHTGHMYWLMGFIGALGSPHAYSPNTQDTATRMTASHFLYGSPLPIPFPDVRRTSFFLMFGANPLMSKGSLFTVPRVKERLDEIVARGGRVVAVDPRRSETARAYEHVAVRADTDAWLLLGLIGEIFREGLEDRAFLDLQTSDWTGLRDAAVAVTPETAGDRTGVPADRIRELARAFATADSAAAYTRTGVCTGSFGTLVNFLVDALNAVTGNLDRPGGAVFGNPPLSFDELGARFGMASYATRRTRIGSLPEVAGLMASAAMPEEITTPGPGQLRALVVGAGNPVLTTPGSVAVEDALERLDLLVCLDLYVTETSKHAHYILPGTTFLEREDLPGTLLQWAATPFVQATTKVVDPPGECREEWHFYDEMARRLGLGGPFSFRSARVLARLGLLRLTPMKMIDLMLRTGRHGDRFGMRRGGLSLRKVLASPHGLLLDEHPATGVLKRKVQHRDRRVHLFHADLAAEIERLQATPAATDPEYPLRLIGRRETRSHNSWMHNVPSKHRQARLQVNPADAEEANVADGQRVRIESPDGAVEVAIEVTDDVVAGTVALPHGWGHAGGWQRANEAGGVNYNLLTSTRTESAERLSGMSHLNGVPVRLLPASSDHAHA